ncbi:MAG: GNAT family N-acetyltransferase [Acidimicrobiia bacterium]|nr:GNAT family N-acetyltransferase [Acidimicrobiia bacterium]
MKLRQATRADAEALCRIYNREVERSTVTLDLVARSVAEQRRYIAERSGGLVVVVAELGGLPDPDAAPPPGIVGFGSLSFYRDRPGYRTSVEDSVYVDRDHHGFGVGSAILGELLRVATDHGFHTVFARIVGPQEASVALHERHGFTMVGIEREVARKFGRWHDVALLQRLL